MFKVLVLLLCASVFGYQPNCDKKTILQYVRIPTYDFSVRILDRISQETDGHFVFSPISTWIQLLALTDGAKGTTLNELLRVTGHRRIICLKKFVRQIFNSIDEDLRVTVQHSSVIGIDKLLNVKQSFINNVEKLNSTKVLLLNFRRISESATKVNEVIERHTNGKITDSIDSDDFKKSVLVMIDAACLKANWRSPFNPVYTKPDTFYSYEKIAIGRVNMMHQIGYFNTSYVPHIESDVLELPFNDRLTMLLFLPRNVSAADLFWSMKNIRMATVLKLLETNGPKLVNIKMPKFKMTTDIDNIPELLIDMGIERVFYPRAADLRRVSDYKVYVSMMMSKADIEVTETGISGNVGPELLVTSEQSRNMFFNQPFVYLVVDKITNVIFFAGIFSDPSVYK